MKKILLILFAIIQLFSLISNNDSVDFKISRSKSHNDQTGKYTPLVVSLSSEDKINKVRGVDLICIVDVSGSMSGTKIKLVQQSLIELVKLMNEEDNFALIKFTSSPTIVSDFTKMNSNNKSNMINKINTLSAYGGTNFYPALRQALGLLKDNYLSGERVCSMILLSDGADGGSNADVNFKNYISSQGKNNYIFTLHTFGYGSDNGILMSNLAAIRDGGYFFIQNLGNVQDSFLEIYGSLSTTYKVNLQLTVQSKFKIEKIYGLEDMFESSLTKQSPYIFTTKIIHFVYGKKYNFVALLDIPENTMFGTEVLKATISYFDQTVKYYWDQVYNQYAYEEYIRCISFTYFLKSYNFGKSKGISYINEGINWIKANYDGIRNWLDEYKKVLNDLENFNSFGKSNLLSKLRELKSSKMGVHYDDENEYQKKIIDDSHKIDVSNFMTQKVTGQTTIRYQQNYNYYYFYLKEGIGEISGLHFSGVGSSIIIYSENTENFNVKPLTNYLEFYYSYENKRRIQTKVDFSHGAKFIFKKDFPFDFYSPVDGRRDITFNIQLLKLQYNQTSEISEHLFEIKAYILDEEQISFLKNKIDSLPNNPLYNGYYDKGFRVGKIIMKKEEISKCLNSNSHNYLYIIIQKVPDSNYIYNYVEGQVSFVSMDYIFANIPENFYIFSNLSIGQKNPHLYSIKMEPTLGNIIRIEFATSGKELDCKVLKYQNYEVGSEEFYKDNEQFKIQRTEHMGKTYIDVYQSTNNETKFDYLILSIFSTNGGYIAGSEIEKLSYTIRYSSFSDYGIYNFNDFNETDGEIMIIHDEEYQNQYTIKFYSLKSEKTGKELTLENSRFFVQVFPIVKKRQKIYETISLFEKSTPEIFLEKELKNQNQSDFSFQVDTNKNYFINLFTISNKNNEIIKYKTEKIYRTINEIEIDDEKSFESELNNIQNIEFKISENITKKYLLIKISDFEDGEYGTLYATVWDKIYKSVQPSSNYIIIPKEKCIGQKIKLDIKLKDGKINIEYYLEIKLVNQIEINVGENLSFEMLEEFRESMEIIINNNDENKMNIFVQSNTGEFSINGLSTCFKENNLFGAKSINIEKSKQVFIEIKAKTGEFISLYTHFINYSKKRRINNYEISLYGLLEEKDCIYFDENINVGKYQVRILGNKEISIRYNKNTTYEYNEPGILYIKEFTEKLDKICLKQKNDLDSIFFGLQIVDISNQSTSKVILQPTVFGAFYKDILYKNEIRYYRQGLFDSNKKDDLRYLYSFRQIKGEIKVYVGECNTFPECKFTKEELERNNKNIELYNIDEYFIYSKRSIDFKNYDPEKFLAYIILCLTDSCEYSFILNKSTSFIDLTRLQKFSSKIYKKNIDKFTIYPKNENNEIISIELYTHSGQVMLSTNDNCEDIKHTIFGHIEKIEIPKSCNINHSFEVYVQANIDSVYSIEYSEISDIKYSNIKSNIIHLENIYKEKLIEFTPIKDSYFIKFIPINCEISIKYDENKYLPSQQSIYYYHSESEERKYYNFTVSTNNSDCMIYTYIEELKEDFYGILSDQVPYYLSLNKNNKNYKLIYPFPNGKYLPALRLNFFEETPIKIIKKILKEEDEEINAVLMKDIKPSSKILEKCDEEGICYLILEIKYEKEPQSPIILEIIPKSSNEIPGVLLDNKLKQDFTQIDGIGQQYMIKILKDEEGEIYFNYKYFSGELSGKIVNIGKTSWKNRYELPEKNEYLPYDNLKQKITF